MDHQKLSDFACKYENFTDYKEEFETFKNGTVNLIMKMHMISFMIYHSNTSIY